MSTKTKHKTSFCSETTLVQNNWFVLDARPLFALHMGLAPQDLTQIWETCFVSDRDMARIIAITSDGKRSPTHITLVP